MDDSFFNPLPVLRLNAWTGEEAAPAVLGPESLNWSSQRQWDSGPSYQGERAPKRVYDWNWERPDVGWGLVLPDDDRIQPPERRATADDAPEPIQRLLAARRHAPVLRWRENASGIGELVRYDTQGNEWPLALESRNGIFDGQLPRFLLIFAAPDRIPWAFQYAANLGHCVGRLWLEGAALDRYVTALLSDWADSTCDLHAPVLWSVDHGQPDITWLMDRAISRPLSEMWEQDADFAGKRYLTGCHATRENLVDELAMKRPGLVVTTSHGMTGPLKDAPAMAAQLGLPVDAQRRALDLSTLLEAWQPDGAIWYAHACCSAGSDTSSAYDGLFDAGSGVAGVLRGVAAGCGARVAPLPMQLLGAQRPLRAFIGHVEPTFDWTLRDTQTRQPLTHGLVDALYRKLFEEGERRPIGWAMEPVFDDVGSLLFQWHKANAAAERQSPGSRERALYYQIAALDRSHTVILGDPTVALPALQGGDSSVALIPRPR